ncbi:MAG TPA: alpha/beta hydrolase [Pseudonocardia sp.]|jgi:pimeloyl-ACP methyl ester carboxylesterase|uniref:alpha/beta fold hydrolase n=1 Tax=Pseudonocardia sp. TaxID=60912 RepID=UPI002C131CEE|nr:alpha/beta hydrolase [Pseudonocardia sp.]HTF55416.1 alpha/beta hydrolase [Pseudonocardia sp.]
MTNVMTNPMPPYVLERHFELVNGQVPAKVYVAGSGEPVLYLHGADGLAWNPLLEALAGQYTVYAPEHPGAGQTDLLHLRDMWDLALYYDELLDALQLPTAAVVGHSFGGMAAAELAANSRPRVSKLVLIAPIGFWRDDAPIADLAGISPEQLIQLLVHDPSGPLAAALAPPRHDPQAMFEAAVRMASILHFIWPLPDKGLKRRLHRVAAPTLLLWGTGDKLVSPVYAEEFDSRLSDSRLELIENAGHLPHLEQPTATCERVLKFLR